MLVNNMYRKYYLWTEKFRSPYKGKLIQNNTRLYRDHNDNVCIRLHKTDVLTFYPDGRIRIATGGWYSRTTKDRINTYLHDVSVFSKNGEWIVSVDSKWYEFENNMVLDPQLKPSTPAVKMPRKMYFTKLLHFLHDLGIKSAY